MKPIINEFDKSDISDLAALRTIILFGRNVSTYKFALCSALLKENTVSELRYTDIRDNFLKELITHYNRNSSQYQAGGNQLTNASDQSGTHEVQSQGLSEVHLSRLQKMKTSSRMRKNKTTLGVRKVARAMSELVMKKTRNVICYP